MSDINIGRLQLLHEGQYVWRRDPELSPLSAELMSAHRELSYE